MNNQRGIAPIIIVLIIVALLVGGVLAWWYFGEQKEEVKAPEEKITEEIKTPETKELEKPPIEKGVFSIKKSEKEAGVPSTPITLSLHIPSEIELETTPPNLKLNEIIEITCTVTSIANAPNTTAEIILPKGVDLISGDITWKGDLKANIPISFSAEIKLTETKNLTIEAVARHIIDEENSWGDMDVIYFNYAPIVETEIEIESGAETGIEPEPPSIEP